MLRAKSPRESRIVGNPPVRFDEGEGSFIGPSLLYNAVLPREEDQLSRNFFAQLVPATSDHSDSSRTKNDDEHEYDPFTSESRITSKGLARTHSSTLVTLRRDACGALRSPTQLAPRHRRIVRAP